MIENSLVIGKKYEDMLCPDDCPYLESEYPGCRDDCRYSDFEYDRQMAEADRKYDEMIDRELED
ncbi:MAG: hypothetical protein WDA47_03185 [Bacilli bacterium]